MHRNGGKMITSVPTRNEVKQILQTIYPDEEITEEMIDESLEGGMFFARLSPDEIENLFPPIQESLFNDKAKL